MIICHCTAATDREIRRCAQEGRPSCRAVAEASGAGAACKGCVPAIQKLLREVLREHQTAVEHRRG